MDTGEDTNSRIGIPDSRLGFLDKNSGPGYGFKTSVHGTQI
jgi:hypothetical protein